MQGPLTCYGRAVAEAEWPAMRDEHRAPVGSLQPTEIRRTLDIIATEGGARPPCDAHGIPG